MSYKHLTFIQRCHIYGLWRAGYNQTEIAKEIGVHKSTISREFQRNITFVRTKLGSWQYKPGYAQHYTEQRQKAKSRQIKFTKAKGVFSKACENYFKTLKSHTLEVKKHNLLAVGYVKEIGKTYELLIPNLVTSKILFFSKPPAAKLPPLKGRGFNAYNEENTHSDRCIYEPEAPNFSV